MTAGDVAVAVVIPVHDEELLLERCLASVSAATRAVAVPVHTYVVLDACTDGSAAVVSRWPVEVLTVEARNVGRARRAGSALAVRRAPAPPALTWLAHTDADSEVPVNWLAHQLDLMTAGVDVMIGTVRPDFADLSPRHIDQWKQTHHRGRPPGHVHGANLGVRASTYLAAGGFRAIPEHEDVQLVQRAVERGARTMASDEAEVLTSGRLSGRTPGGYAGHLRRIAEELADGAVA